MHTGQGLPGMPAGEHRFLKCVNQSNGSQAPSVCTDGL